MIPVVLILVLYVITVIISFGLAYNNLKNPDSGFSRAPYPLDNVEKLFLAVISLSSIPGICASIIVALITKTKLKLRYPKIYG